jgi:hypothetical protein
MNAHNQRYVACDQSKPEPAPEAGFASPADRIPSATIER